jgi:hypothetical protein
MNGLVKFFHEIFNPHCEHCESEKLRIFEAKREVLEQENHCTSCETLQVVNDTLIRENQRLVDALIEKNKNIPEPVQTNEPLRPIRTTTHVPWNVRRQLKEQESRAALQARKDAAQPDKVNTKSIDKDAELKELEKELEDVSATKETA